MFSFAYLFMFLCLFVYPFLYSSFRLLVILDAAVMKYTVLGRREFIIGAVATLVSLPLSLYRNVERLIQVY